MSLNLALNTLGLALTSISMLTLRPRYTSDGDSRYVRGFRVCCIPYQNKKQLFLLLRKKKNDRRDIKEFR